MTTLTQAKPAGHILGLDGLRALAVIAVVWHHTHPGFAGLPISHNGFLGVDVFSVLSGFLITSLLLNEQRLTGTISLRSFYIRRGLRIFPLYYVVLAALAGYFAYMGTGKASNGGAFLHELPWHVSYTSNWVNLQSMMAITWSLSTEEQFYIVWPPLLAWLGKRSIAPLLVFLGVNQAINFGALDSNLAALGIPYASLSILQITFSPILLGVLLAFMLRLAYVKRLVKRLPEWTTIAVCIIVIALANVPGDVRGWPRLSFHLATSCLIGMVVLRPQSAVVRALEWRPLAYVGTVSYGVYLLHKIVLHVVDRALGAAAITMPELVFASCLLGTVALAGLSFRYFERPILTLKSRVHQSRQRGTHDEP